MDLSDFIGFLMTVVLPRLRQLEQIFKCTDPLSSKTI